MVPRIVLITALLALAACSAPPVREADLPPAGSTTSPVPPPQPDTGASAVTGLLADARTACDRGDYNTATAKLQRAQRVAPRDARVYLEFAYLHTLRNQPDRAKAMAERGLLYCKKNACDQLKKYL